MAFQIIFVVETDEKSRSDYIYIRSVLDKWYNLHLLNDVKVTPVFMRGKGNYKKKSIVNQIESNIKKYSKIGETYVVYCFDTDQYDCNANALKTLLDEEQFCSENGYEFVWFCHDIEEVFLGQSISKSEKTDRARQYASSHGVENVNKTDLQAEEKVKRKSNLIVVLEKIFKD